MEPDGHIAAELTSAVVEAATKVRETFKLQIVGVDAGELAINEAGATVITGSDADFAISEAGVVEVIAVKRLCDEASRIIGSVAIFEIGVNAELYICETKEALDTSGAVREEAAEGSVAPISVVYVVAFAQIASAGTGRGHGGDSAADGGTPP
jgi:hypothetical protein